MAEPPEKIAGLVARLGLQPHPEGGWFAETWRDRPAGGGRGAGSAIYYLLPAGESSAWHRVDAAEVWHHYGGAAVDLSVAVEGGELETIRLGSSIADGEMPQAVVPAGAWQTARSVGSWSLVGCTVSPAFAFEGFELAPEGLLPVVPALPATAADRAQATAVDPVLGELARYHAWADRMLLAACRLVPAERLADAAPGTYGTIILTLEHLVSSEAEFLGVLGAAGSSATVADGSTVPADGSTSQSAAVPTVDGTPVGRPSDRPQIPPDVRLAEVERRLAELDARLVGVVSAGELAGPAPDAVPLDRRGIVLQIVTHAIAHRAQVVSALSAAGAWPPALDFVFYAVDPGPR